MTGAALPSAPVSADVERERAAAWDGMRSSLRDIRCAAAVADVVAEHARAVAAVAERRAAVDRLAGDVRTQAEAFEVVDRRAPHSFVRAIGVLAEEYDRLRARTDVADVTITDDAITVTTTDLIVHAGGDRWDIGAYRVALPRSGALNKVQITSVRGNWVPTGSGHASHPHVFSSRICWGNLWEPVERALRDAEYDVAFEYVLLLLKTPLPEGESSSLYRDILERIGRKVA